MAAIVPATPANARIAIVQQVGRALVVGKGVAELLRRPRGGRVIGDRDMHDASAFVGEDHQHEQQAIRGGRDHEEVGGHDLADVVREERPPRLRRWASATHHVLRDGGLTHGDPELLQLAVDARRTPERVRVRHRADQRADVGRYGRPARAVSALPGPEQAEPTPVPRDDGVRLHEDERRPPLGPDAREPHPEQPVGCGETEARSARAFQDLQLVSEGENLEVQRRARANQRTER